MLPICLAGAPAALRAAASGLHLDGLLYRREFGGAWRVHNFDDNVFIPGVTPPLLFLLANNNNNRNNGRFIGGGRPA